MIAISKFIPFDIRIKSLYWVRKEKEIDEELTQLFKVIDADKYNEGRIMLEQLREKWEVFSHNAPQWFQLEYLSQFSKAESMLNFLQSEQ